MNDLIVKWLDNPECKLTLKELYFILDYIQNPNNQSLLEEHFRKSYNFASEASPRLSDQKIDAIYHLIQAKINEQEKKSRKLSMQKISHIFMRAAAILILPISVFAVYSYLSNKDSQGDLQLSGSYPMQMVASRVEYFSPPGARTRILLPDSSQVWLNGKSKLSVGADFNGTTRDVELLGEAFFSVQKNPARPFNVHTSEAVLQVLGTTFNVAAYEEDSCIETTLVTGEVNLIYKKEDKAQLVKIQPSQKVSLNKAAKNISTEVVDTDVYQSWKDGKIILRNHSLKQVVSILEKWFNVHITYDSNLEGYKFTATLDNKSLDQILMFISFSSPINYTFNDNTVHLTARN